MCETAVLFFSRFSPAKQVTLDLVSAPASCAHDRKQERSMSMKSATLFSLIVTSLAVLLWLAAMPVQLAAQDAASLTGIVTDTSGAVVVDSKVKLADTRTNTAYETKTNSVGAYFFNKLLPGAGYKVTFTK